MRVLYVVDRYPALSESYIRVELEYFHRCGVELEIVTRSSAMEDGISPYLPDVPVPFTVVKTPTASGVLSFQKPDVVHIHFLHTALETLHVFSSIGAPVTVRGHSFDFDPERVRQLSAHSAVKRIWLFPAHAEQFRSGGAGDAKVRPLPAAYASAVFRPPAVGDRPSPKTVFRASSGQPRKDLKTFIRTASRCPERKFILAIARSPMYPDYYIELLKYAEWIGAQNFSMTVDQPRETVAKLVLEAGLVLRTHDDESHPYGQPVSVLEAVASGAVPILNDRDAARHYAGGAALYAQGRGPEAISADAARLIRETDSWTKENWTQARRRCLDMATKHRDDVVLPQIVEAWNEIVAR